MVKHKRYSTRKNLIFTPKARNRCFGLSACVISENFEAVKMYFGDDLHASRLFDQLTVLCDAATGVSVKMKDAVSSTLAFTSNCNIS